MSIHTSQVLDYLDAHPVSRYEGDFHSLLEMLHYIYSTCNPIDGEKIRVQFRQIRSITACLPFLDADQLITEVCLLCYEHEKQAFFHGITVGMRLMTEINALP